MSRYPEQLATERLILRPPSPDDAPGVLDAVTASYAELHRWMDWAKAPYGIDEARAFCAAARTAFEDGEEFATLMTLPGHGRIIGSAGLVARDMAVPSFEIGYWIHTAHAGQGYVTEAARALARLAFEGLGSRRIEIRMDENNRRSCAVAERLGFEWEATLKAHRRDNLGQLVATRLYAMFDGSQLATARG